MEDKSELKGYIDLRESVYEGIIAYGTITIPIHLIEEALQAGDTRMIKGREAVTLSFSLYEYDKSMWKFEGPPPLLTGPIKRKKSRKIPLKNL